MMKKALILMTALGWSYGSLMGSETCQIAESINPDECLGDQSTNSADIDISNCPRLPNYPEQSYINGESVGLGAWELNTTISGATYKYGELSFADDSTTLIHADGSDAVDQVNLDCWAKGYYRLRQILKNPPASYLELRDLGFQKRFFQFQTDLRNGSNGYYQISSYRDHLVKWVTLVTEDGRCILPTADEFAAYAAAEVTRRTTIQESIAH